VTRNIRLFVIIVVIQVGLAVAIAHRYTAAGNTLKRNGNWVSSKTSAEGGMMGSRTFMDSAKALTRGRVNLGHSFGYQEITYHEPVAARRVAVDFRLNNTEYFALMFNRTDTGMSGIRFSQSPRFESCYFTATTDGEFLSTRPLDLGSWDMHGWAHAEITFRDDGFDATLDDRELVSVTTEIAQPQRIGFRGCETRVYVDNIRIEHAGGVFEESFYRTAAFLRALLIVLLAFAACGALAAWIVRRRGIAPRRALLRTLMLTLVAAMCTGAVLYAYETVLSPYYANRGLATMAAFLDMVEETRTREIRDLHTAQPAPGIRRVLVIGSSQTWGEGAELLKDGWVPVLQRRLGPDFECINAGLRGFRAQRLARIFDENWSRLAPKLVVVNLCNNDRDPKLLSAALEQIVLRSRAIGAQVLFVEEAKSFESDHANVIRNQAAMTVVAQRHDVPVVAMYDYMQSQYARGFLWWDDVHPTGFGHRLIAEHLEPYIRANVSR